jgi:hypothetical protein
MKRILAFSILALAVLAAHGQTAAFNGYCTQGGVSAQTSGLPSTNKLQGIIPQCNVEVFLTGTTTLATIYSDSSSTHLTNPFTANTLGKWLFYAATGQGYDVVMSGGFPPLVYPNPVTLTDLMISGGGGGDLSGTLTPGIIPVAIAPHALGDSSVDQDLTNVGSVTIGLNNPLYPTTATCDGTECTVTVGNNYAVDQNVLLGDDFSESCLTDSGEVNVDTASSTQFTFAEDETSCTGVISSTGGTITNYYEGFIVNSDENRIAQFLHSGGAYIHNNTVISGEPLGDLSAGICLTTDVNGGCFGVTPPTEDSDIIVDSGEALQWYSDSPADATLNDSQICTMATGCGGSGSPSINVDGVTVSNPNLDSTTPVADSGYTLGTWKESGSNISVEVPAVTASQVNTLLQGLTGCNTAGYLYSPQSGICVAPSGGYTPTQSVVTSSRVLGTVYQNTTGSMMLVTVMFWSNRANDSFTVKSDSNSSPSTTTVSATAGNDSSITSAFGTTFAVLPGNYYVISSSYALTIDSWTEWTIG